MNNLKRVLSLALSGVMLTGLLTVGAGAVGDFTDAEKIEHQNAVDILCSLNIINGIKEGDETKFDPQGDVTRGMMAKMICVAMNGGSEKTTGKKGTPSFTDIGGHWAEEYIEYCYDLGIISGRGNGIFAPDDKVTGLEAAKMVLTALGYDETAYMLTGAKWAARTDELARKATPKLYEDLDGVAMATAASRDTAAQLIWNGLQNKTRSVDPAQNTTSGEVTNNFNEGQKSLLTERYGADVLTGVFAGNKSTGATSFDGCIRVAGREFVSDYPISYIGEEVKVVWKDGKDGGVTKGTLDRKDVIYGVFNTNATDVIRTYADKVAEVKDASKKQIKIDGATYDLKDKTDTTPASPITALPVTVDYCTTNNKDITDANDNQGNSFTKFIMGKTASRDQNVDKVKFVLEEGKVARAYVETLTADKVLSVSGKKVNLGKVSGIDLEKNDNKAYEGIAKNDVVFYTKFYDSDKDKATFNIVKAESVEGKVTGYKTDGSKIKNISVDGTTYKVNEQGFKNLSSDNMTGVGSGSGNAAVGDTVCLYLIGDAKYVAGVKSLEKSGGNYGVITARNSSNVINGEFDSLSVAILTTDNQKIKAPVHKDSKYDGTTKMKGADGNIVTAADRLLKVGANVEYSMSGDQIKIVNIVADTTYAVPAGGQGTKFWNEKARTITVGAGANDVYTAAADCTLFATIDGDFYQYNIRDLKNITSKTPNMVTVNSFIQNDDSEIIAVYATLTKKPTTGTETTLYGLITSYDQTAKVGDTNVYTYTVATSDGEKVTVNIDSSSDSLADGFNPKSLEKSIVKFDEASDAVYDASDVTFVTKLTTDKIGPVAFKSYSSDNRKVIYYTKVANTAEQGVAAVYEGVDGFVDSVTTDKDVEIIGIDLDNKTCGTLGDVVELSPSTGYANGFIMTDDGIATVIFVETSDTANITNADVTGFAGK